MWLAIYLARIRTEAFRAGSGLKYVISKEELKRRKGPAIRSSDGRRLERSGDVIMEVVDCEKIVVECEAACFSWSGMRYKLEVFKIDSNVTVNGQLIS